MSPNERDRKMAVLDQADLPYRVRWYLLGAYAGAGRVKRIARDLDVSLRKAARLLAGENVTTSDLQAMAKRYGHSFTTFIFAPLAPGNADGFTRTAASAKAGIEALDRATRGGPLSVVRPAVAPEPRNSASGKDTAGDRPVGGEAPTGSARPIKRAAE